MAYRSDRPDDPGQPVKSILLGLSHLVPLVADVAETLAGEVTGCPFLASFVEVEVDTETGEVEVLDIVQVNDCGKIMYRAGAEGQLIGGQAMATSETLLEEIVYDERTGLPLNFNWVDYRIATMADAPPVEPLLLEVWKGAGHYPACGIGESVTTATPCAIANAVYNAIGVRINELPITPDKVLRAIGRIGRGHAGPGAAALAQGRTVRRYGERRRCAVSEIRYEAASSARHARELLCQAGGNAMPLAGGTDVFGTVKDGIHADRGDVLLVDLKTVPGLDTVAIEGSELVIGATTRLADVVAGELVREHAPMLAQAAELVASPQLREMGTVGRQPLSGAALLVLPLPRRRRSTATARAASCAPRPSATTATTPCSARPGSSIRPA